MNKPVVVIGAMLLDVKGKPTAGLEPETSNPGATRLARGGTARNVAENLGRLGADVFLVSAIADDLVGQLLLQPTIDAGVNVDYVQILPKRNSGVYIALLTAEGHLSVALDDVTIMEAITPAYLTKQEHLFQQASMIVLDGSLTRKTINTAVELAKKYAVPICMDPSSTRLAYKLLPHLSTLDLVVPNEIEAGALLDLEFVKHDPDESVLLAQQLVKLGVKTAVITLTDFGIVYATSDETGYIPARYSKIVDTTGTGDAFTAAMIFGFLEKLPTIESIRLGVAAISLTLQTSDTVVPDLTLDMLYEHLLI